MLYTIRPPRFEGTPKVPIGKRETTSKQRKAVPLRLKAHINDAHENSVRLFTLINPVRTDTKSHTPVSNPSKKKIRSQYIFYDKY